MQRRIAVASAFRIDGHGVEQGTHGDGRLSLCRHIARRAGGNCPGHDAGEDGTFRRSVRMRRGWDVGRKPVLALHEMLDHMAHQRQTESRVLVIEFDRLSLVQIEQR